MDSKHYWRVGWVLLFVSAIIGVPLVGLGAMSLYWYGGTWLSGTPLDWTLAIAVIASAIALGLGLWIIATTLKHLLDRRRY